MQRAYFLGGSGPAGFVTDFPAEQQEHYGILLKGGPGTGKSTLMNKLAAAFAGEAVSVYHCASDPHSLDAVVFEERGVYITDATAPHEQSTPLPHVTGELCDLAAGLDRDAVSAHAEEITQCYRENQSLHAMAKKGYAGIAAMEASVVRIGQNALLRDKLSGYARRMTKRMLPKKAAREGKILRRACAAMTPQGTREFIPAEFDRMLLHDPCMTAAPLLLAAVAEAAVHAGLDAECTRSLTAPDRPLTHVILPELMLAFSALPGDCPDSAAVTDMKRFYDADILRAQRNLLRFCRKTADAAAEQTAALLSEALQVHDRLETYYIAALDTAFLDSQAAALISRVLQFPRKA
jgi:hypothetical protein